MVEAGCDEAGRGCLAGSVYAAAVILPEDYRNDLLTDSKQLPEKRRYQLRDIIQRDAVAWAVGIVTPEEIDRINILNASILAMHRALDQLTTRPEAIIVDGNRFKPYYPQTPNLKSPTRPSSRVTANTSPSLLPASSPRPTATTIWIGWPKSIPNTTGRRTRATQRRNIARLLGSTVQHPTTA